MSALLRLQKLLHENPHLDRDNHYLNSHVKEVKDAIESRMENVDDLIDRIETEKEAEDQTLVAAFKRFDTKGKKQLGKQELKLMCNYLGFPSGEEDVNHLMKVIDTDGSGTVSPREFIDYVGKMGGSMRLFEARRARLSCEGGDLVSSANLQASLNDTGFAPEAQAAWRLVVAPSEFAAVAELKRCQRDAVRHIRILAKANHEKALPQVQKRVVKLGYKDTDLWLTLAWIREMAPIIVHVNLDKMLQFMEKDTHYRNQFETGASGGLLNTGVREKWEKDLFGGKYDKAKGPERPKYGVQNVMNDHRGVKKCAQYGDSYLVLKDVRLRCTFSPEDSANLKAERLAVCDYYAHVLNEYSEAELKETLKVSTSTDAALLGDSDSVGKMKYKEAQLHGEVAFARHVERLVAHDRHRSKDGSRLKAVAKKFGWQFSWMDQERKRMQEEDMHKLGGEEWKKRLTEMAEPEDDVEVEEGYCVKGCGRPVCPGVTRSGKPFRTCCRGCVMGFGHDLTCGKIDPSKVGVGLCKNGCGRPVATGKDSKGRPLTTCCRGCALGLDHDPTCVAVPAGLPDMSRSRSTTSGRADAAWMCPACGEINKEHRTECNNCGAARRDVAAKVLCKAGCGRTVAPGTTRSGKPFDTCCRGCATGQPHTSECDVRASDEGIF